MGPFYGLAQSFYANILLMHIEPQKRAKAGDGGLGLVNKARLNVHLHQKLSGIFPPCCVAVFVVNVHVVRGLVYGGRVCVLHFGQEIKLHFHYFRIARQSFGHSIRSTGPQFNYKLPKKQSKKCLIQKK